MPIAASPITGTVTSQTLVLGSWPIHLALREDLAREVEETALAGFLASAAEGPPYFRITQEERGRMASLHVPEGPTDSPLMVQAHRWDEWLIARKDVTASLDLASRSARISYAESALAVDTVCRVLLAQCLPAVGGLLLHAAGLRWRGRAYLFPGVSGVGKTTLAEHHLDAAEVFCDEICLLERRADAWWLHPTPFWGKMPAREPIPAAPLAGVFLLHQDATSYVQDLPAIAALRALMRCVLYFPNDAKGPDETLAVSRQLVGEVPVRRLSCKPGTRFWEASGWA